LRLNVRFEHVVQTTTEGLSAIVNFKSAQLFDASRLVLGAFVAFIVSILGSLVGMTRAAHHVHTFHRLPGDTGSSAAKLAVRSLVLGLVLLVAFVWINT